MKRCNKCNTKRCNCKVVINKPVEIITKGKGNDGLSAYELAVLNGYIGTEQEWLESLEGKDGGSYQVDEEDVTVSEDLKLHFKDRDDSKGLGYKILRLESGNTLSSSDFEADTIHEIRYDFDLDGGKLELPENVTLKFNGGSISNGEIVGNNTKIDAGLNKIFEGVEFSGLFQLDAVFPEWFGAVSYERNFDSFNDPSEDLVNGIDSSEAINKALEFAYLTSGTTTKLVGFGYKISHIYMPDQFSELFISPNTILYAYAQGDSQKVCLQDKELLTFEEYNVTDPEVRVINQSTGQPFNYVVALRENEFISSDSMAHVISMPSWGGRITGRGTLVLRYSKYAIGVYVRSNTYKATDMAFAPHLDLRIYDGGWNNVTGNKEDFYGTGAPSNDLGSQGDWYWQVDRTTGSGRYVKGASTWNQGQNQFDNRFNTSIRLEAGLGDNRIINFNGFIYNLSGHRGVEFIVHGVRGGSGGWINSSFWEGTISNKTGGGIFFFGEPDMDDHNFEKVNMQLGPINSTSFRFIYGQPRDCRFGKIWDLYYFRGSIRTIGMQLEFLRGSRNNVYQSDEWDSFVIDNGLGNKNKKGYPYEDLIPQSANSHLYMNALKFRTPDNARFLDRQFQGRYNFKFLDSFTSVEDSWELFRNEEPDVSKRGFFPSELFDEDYGTGVIAVDTSNDVFGFGGMILRSGEYNIAQRTDSRFICIEYELGVGTEAVLVVGYGDTEFPMVYDLSKGGYIDAKGSVLFRLRTIMVPINQYYHLQHGSNAIKNVSISIVPREDIEDQFVRVVNFKLLVKSPYYGSDYNPDGLRTGVPSSVYNGRTELRPNACPKGWVYFDTTTNAPFINVGDSGTQVWKKLLTED